MMYRYHRLRLVTHEASGVSLATRLLMHNLQNGVKLNRAKQPTAAAAAAVVAIVVCSSGFNRK